MCSLRDKPLEEAVGGGPPELDGPPAGDHHPLLLQLNRQSWTLPSTARCLTSVLLAPRESGEMEGRHAGWIPFLNVVPVSNSTMAMSLANDLSPWCQQLLGAHLPLYSGWEITLVTLYSSGLAPSPSSCRMCSWVARGEGVKDPPPAGRSWACVPLGRSAPLLSEMLSS